MDCQRATTAGARRRPAAASPRSRQSRGPSLHGPCELTDDRGRRVGCNTGGPGKQRRQSPCPWRAGKGTCYTPCAPLPLPAAFDACGRWRNGSPVPPGLSGSQREFVCWAVLRWWWELSNCSCWHQIGIVFVSLPLWRSRGRSPHAIARRSHVVLSVGAPAAAQAAGGCTGGCERS